MDKMTILGGDEVKNKNRRKYKDGDKVVIDGCEFIISAYHYPSMSYIIKRSDGLTTLVKEEEFDTIKE